MPDVPTTSEQGFPYIQMQHWGGIYAPKGTPSAILDRIAKALQTSFQTDPEMRAKLEATGNEPKAGTRADFEHFIEAEKKRLGKIVVDSKMTLD
jgi:tripartite-type tricarboxylate transporter receptor subunit TctC